MAEQPAASRPPEPEVTAAAEDAGRLDGASPGRLAAILAVLILFVEVVPFQYSMVSVIVPKIGGTFPEVGASVSWTVTILGVVGGATMALVGKAADLWGKKRVLLAASLFFLLGTLICIFADDWWFFLVGRGLASISWGMSAVAYGIVRDIMPRKWIPICVGFIGTGFGLSGVIGPIVCGQLTDHYSWRSVFWFLLIYQLIVLPLFFLVVPESPVRTPQRFDVVGALLLGGGVGGTLIYVSMGTDWGWSDPGCVAYLIVGLILIAAFIAWERRATDPIMEIPLLRAPKVSFVVAMAFFVTGLIAGINIVVAYMFQTPTEGQLMDQIVGAAAAQSGAPAEMVAPFISLDGDVSYGAGFSVTELALHVTMWTAVFGLIFGPLGGALARRYGSRLPLIIGSVALVVACALWVQWHTTWQQQAFIGVLLGLGSGFYYAASPNLLMDAVPPERQGVTAGMNGVLGAIGTSVAVALVTAFQENNPVKVVAKLPTGGTRIEEVPQVYSDTAYTQAYLWLGVIPAVIALALALALKSGRAPARGGETDRAKAAPQTEEAAV